MIFVKRTELWKTDADTCYAKIGLEAHNQHIPPMYCIKSIRSLVSEALALSSPSFPVVSHNNNAVL